MKKKRKKKKSPPGPSIPISPPTCSCACTKLQILDIPSSLVGTSFRELKGNPEEIQKIKNHFDIYI